LVRESFASTLLLAFLEPTAISSIITNEALRIAISDEGSIAVELPVEEVVVDEVVVVEVMDEVVGVVVEEVVVGVDDVVVMTTITELEEEVVDEELDVVVELDELELEVVTVVDEVVDEELVLLVLIVIEDGLYSKVVELQTVSPLPPHVALTVYVPATHCDVPPEVSLSLNVPEPELTEVLLTMTRVF
jgi:hypothetical protein